MFARIRDTRENESGFTLIELLIVIVILGVLAGIVTFSVSGISDRGKASACAANVKTIKVAGEAYYAQKGTYAANVAALVTAGFLQLPTPPTTEVTYTAVNAVAPAVSTLTVSGIGTCAP